MLSKSTPVNSPALPPIAFNVIERLEDIIMAHAQAPISNISDLNSLKSTTSITLPKKRHGKQILMASVIALSILCNLYYFSTLSIVQNLFGEETAVVESEPAVEQIVPLAPNPDIMPSEMIPVALQPPPVQAAVPEVVPVAAPAVPKSKTMVMKAKAKPVKKAILKYKAKTSKVQAKAVKKVVKTSVKSKNTKAGVKTKAVTQSNASR